MSELLNEEAEKQTSDLLKVIKQKKSKLKKMMVE
jgi:hypothetical protein